MLFSEELVIVIVSHKLKKKSHIICCVILTLATFEYMNCIYLQIFQCRQHYGCFLRTPGVVFNDDP